MKYYFVEDWLYDEPTTYDFVEDTIPIDGKYDKLTKGFGRFFIYRGSKYDKSHNKYLSIDAANLALNYKELAESFNTCDPDVNSDLLKLVYQELWPETLTKAPCSDTMTSAQTLLGKAVGLVLKECKYKDIYINDSRSKELEKIVGAYVASNACIALFANDMDDDRLGFHSAMKKNYPLLEGFLSVYHTIGNYCPVPEGFNVARGKFPYDFWDLTLELIREFYYTDDISNTRLFTLIYNNAISEDSIKTWLSAYGEGESGWRNFIDTMLMQDYVDPETYDVLPLWSGHTRDDAYWSLKTMTKEEIEIASVELISRIMKRGKRIVSKLKEYICEIPINIEGFDLNKYKVSTRICREYRLEGKRYYVIADAIEGDGETIVLVEDEKGGGSLKVAYADWIDYIGDNDSWAVSSAMDNMSNDESEEEE